MANKGHQTKHETFAKGGAVLGRTREFLKIPDQFTDGRLPPKDSGSPDDPPQDYEKSGKSSTAKGKTLKPVKPQK